MTGRVTRLMSDKGFGFIKSNVDGREFFFHRSSVSKNFDDLREGDVLEFEESVGPKGPRAENVRLTSG